MKNPIIRFLKFWAWISTKEELPHSFSTREAASSSSSMRTLLLSRDKLPAHSPATSSSSHSLMREVLFTRDRLPEASPQQGPQAAYTGPSLRKIYFTRDKLPRISLPQTRQAPTPASSFWTWLFSGEKLPNPAGSQPSAKTTVGE